VTANKDTDTSESGDVSSAADEDATPPEAIVIGATQEAPREPRHRPPKELVDADFDEYFVRFGEVAVEEDDEAAKRLQVIARERLKKAKEMRRQLRAEDKVRRQFEALMAGEQAQAVREKREKDKEERRQRKERERVEKEKRDQERQARRELEAESKREREAKRDEARKRQLERNKVSSKSQSQTQKLTNRMPGEPFERRHRMAARHLAPRPTVARTVAHCSTCPTTLSSPMHPPKWRLAGRHTPVYRLRRLLR
jgi:hypothetical protein